MYEKARHQVAVIPVETTPCDVESDSSYRNIHIRSSEADPLRLVACIRPPTNPCKRDIRKSGRTTGRGMESEISRYGVNGDPSMASEYMASEYRTIVDGSHEARKSPSFTLVTRPKNEFGFSKEIIHWLCIQLFPEPERGR